MVRSTPSGATITRIDDFTVQVKVASSAASFSFDFTGFVNPFSQLKDSSAQESKFDVKHYGSCDLSNPSGCQNGVCKHSAPEFTGPSTATLGTPTSTISHSSGVNYIGASDGEITFTMTAGSYFPKYGGSAKLYLPNWYGTDSEPVFTVDQTKCSSDHLIIDP
jgi:hypothetical protein